MQQTLTAKLQIFPKPSDRQLLFDTSKAYSAACTYVSDYVHANHTPLNIFRIQKATYQTCRESFGLRSQMAVSVTRTVIAAYKSQIRDSIRADSVKRNVILISSRPSGPHSSASSGTGIILLSRILIRLSVFSALTRSGDGSSAHSVRTPWIGLSMKEQYTEQRN